MLSIFKREVKRILPGSGSSLNKFSPLIVANNNNFYRNFSVSTNIMDNEIDSIEEKEEMVVEELRDINGGLLIPKIDELGRAYGTGRRKTSVARVWVKEGSGEFKVNNKNFTSYFQPIQREHTLGAFMATQSAGFFDVKCTVKGGGMTGQAGAVRLGISRALQAFDPSYRSILRKGNVIFKYFNLSIYLSNHLSISFSIIYILYLIVTVLIK
jgi:ribosomal protein S9